jgi:DNA-binding HxlR family transcriptional regulator
MHADERPSLKFAGSLKLMKEKRVDPSRQAKPALFIGKWTVKTLYLLTERPHRHGELRRRLGTVSQRMLTRTLRNLEASGLISRQVTQSRSVAVEYSLTKFGKTFIVPLRSMCRWCGRNGLGLTATVGLVG